MFRLARIHSLAKAGLRPAKWPPRATTCRGYSVLQASPLQKRMILGGPQKDMGLMNARFRPWGTARSLFHQTGPIFISECPVEGTTSIVFDLSTKNVDVLHLGLSPETCITISEDNLDDDMQIKVDTLSEADRLAWTSFVKAEVREGTLIKFLFH